MSDEEALLHSETDPRKHWHGVTVRTGGAHVASPPQRCEGAVSEVRWAGGDREVKALQVSRILRLDYGWTHTVF